MNLDNRKDNNPGGYPAAINMDAGAKLNAISAFYKRG